LPRAGHDDDAARAAGSFLRRHFESAGVATQVVIEKFKFGITAGEEVSFSRRAPAAPTRNDFPGAIGEPCLAEQIDAPLGSLRDSGQARSASLVLPSRLTRPWDRFAIPVRRDLLALSCRAD